MLSPAEAIKGTTNEQLLREVRLRLVASDLYNTARNTLFSIPQFVRKYAEKTWAGKSLGDGDWINITLQAPDGVFEVYHHPDWQVLSIDRVVVDPETQQRRIVDSIEVRTGSPKAGEHFRTPHFERLEASNTEYVADEFREFMADVARKTTPSAPSPRKKRFLFD